MEPHDTNGRPVEPPVPPRPQQPQNGWAYPQYPNGQPYPPQGQGYPPNGQPYPPQSQGYPQGSQPYPPQGQGYPSNMQRPNVPPQGAYYYPQGGYVPQGNYRPQGGYVPQPAMYHPQSLAELQKKREEKHTIRRLGNLVGLAIIAFVVLQNLLVLPLMPMGLLERFYSDGLFYYSGYIFLSILGVALPFVALGFLLKKETPHTLYPLRKPKDALVTVLSLPIGLGVCMAANIVTNIIIRLFDLFQIHFKQPDSPDVPGGVLGGAIFFVAIAVIPALCEEISMRGVVLQTLKKYGGMFALIASSLVFGLMHGNMVQIPFAMIVGGIIAFFVLKTDSLWPGILIHFGNNGISAILQMVGDHVENEKTLVLINAAVIWGLILVGAAAAAFLFYKRRNVLRTPLAKGTAGGALNTGEKLGAFFFNPGMGVAVVIMLLLTFTNVTFGSGM